MSSLMIFNTCICLTGFLIGAYTFVKHLKAFSQVKTPTVDACFVSFGTLGWSVFLYVSFTDTATHLEIFSRVLILVYWIGDILKVQKHCLKLRRLKRQK